MIQIYREELSSALQRPLRLRACAGLRPVAGRSDASLTAYCAARRAGQAEASGPGPASGKVRVELEASGDARRRSAQTRGEEGNADSRGPRRLVRHQRTTHSGDRPESVWPHMGHACALWAARGRGGTATGVVCVADEIPSHVSTLVVSAAPDRGAVVLRYLILTYSMYIRVYYS